MPRKTKFKEGISYSPSRTRGPGGSRRKARAMKEILRQAELDVLLETPEHSDPHGPRHQ